MQANNPDKKEDSYRGALASMIQVILNWVMDHSYFLIAGTLSSVV